LRDARSRARRIWFQGDFGLGLKLNRIRHPRLVPPLAVFDPRPRQ
jgi:hypothetical protein